MTAESPRPAPPPTVADVVRSIQDRPLPDQVAAYEDVHRQLVARLKASET